MTRQTYKLAPLAVCMGLLLGPPGAEHRAAQAAAPALQAAVYTSSSTVSTATLFDVAVQVTDPAADSYRVFIDWGDGTTEEYQRQVSCVPGSSSRPLSVKIPARRAYRVPGDYQITTRVDTDGCSAAGESTTATTTMRVQPGAQPSNGPHATRLTYSSYRVDSKARRLGVGLDAADFDGHLGQVSINWGDGQTSRLGGPTCTDPIRHWPSSRRHAEFLHTYAGSSKNYTVTATATSSGCDGRSSTTKTIARQLAFR